jgi:hypothetical protein
MSSYNTVARKVYRLVNATNTTPAYDGLVGTVQGNLTTTSQPDSPYNTLAMTTARWASVASPVWVPETDNFPSLTMSALTVDPDNSVPTRPQPSEDGVGIVGK